MYAIVEIAGQQFKVEKNKRVYVHRLEANEGTNVEFDNVLLIDNAGKIQVGTPSVDGARVAAKVLSHLKGDKVIVFKKKRRKGYAVKNGHRQYLTEIFVQGIFGKGEAVKIDESAAPKKAAPKKVAEEVVEVKAEKKAPAKKAAAKKAAPAAKKAPAKKK